MTWAGTDPVAWAMRQKQNINELLPRATVAMAQLMARTLPEGGRTPIRTGNLSRSVTISTSPLNVGGPDLRYSRQDYASASIAVAGVGVAYIQYRANYAYRQNFGFVGEDSLGRYYNQSGYGFREAAVAQWGQIFSNVAREIAK